MASLVKHVRLLHINVYEPKSRRTKSWQKILSWFLYDIRLVLIKAFKRLTNMFPKLSAVIPFSSSIHGSFDVYSPSINVKISKENIISLFEENGFKTIRKLNPRWCNAALSSDIHIQGEKK